MLLACTVDEEFTHLGSSQLAEMDHHADLAVVAEPTSLDLVHCHKGVARWKIRTNGVACHSSTPALGVNAIYRMGKVLDSLEKYAGTLSRQKADETLGPPTLSVGRIEGGESVNVVPDWCEIEVDRRMIPGEDTAACVRHASEWLEAEVGHTGGFEFAPPWVQMPPMPVSASAWLEPLSAAIETATGRKPAVRGVPFGTDAGPLSAKGTRCVVFGPGDIAQAHTKDEWVDLNEVALASEAYFRIAVELGRTSGVGHALA